MPSLKHTYTSQCNCKIHKPVCAHGSSCRVGVQQQGYPNGTITVCKGEGRGVSVVKAHRQPQSSLSARRTSIAIDSNILPDTSRAVCQFSRRKQRYGNTTLASQNVIQSLEHVQTIDSEPTVGPAVFVFWISVVELAKRSLAAPPLPWWCSASWS